MVSYFPYFFPASFVPFRSVLKMLTTYVHKQCSVSPFHDEKIPTIDQSSIPRPPLFHPNGRHNSRANTGIPTPVTTHFDVSHAFPHPLEPSGVQIHPTPFFAAPQSIPLSVRHRILWTPIHLAALAYSLLTINGTSWNERSKRYEPDISSLPVSSIPPKPHSNNHSYPLRSINQ